MNEWEKMRNVSPLVGWFRSMSHAREKQERLQNIETNSSNETSDAEEGQKMTIKM